MTEEAAKNLADTIQHSDQLFDENNFQEAYDLLQKCSVSIFTLNTYFLLYLCNLIINIFCNSNRKNMK